MLTGWRLSLSKMFIIPQRYVLGIMAFLAIVNSYTMRVSLSIAITEMVVSRNSTSSKNPDACPVESSNTSSSTNVIQGKVYDWDEHTQGLILGAFFWGYAITQLPGGILAEKYGGKYTLGLGMLCTAVFTLITPWVIYLSDGNWVYLFVFRLLEGLGEGTTYPALNSMLGKWVPVDERGRIGTLIYAGNQMGTILSNLISGALISATNDWASVFYLFGGIGVVWFVFWQLLCYNEPEDHPFISDKEKEYLKRTLDGVSHGKKKIPWRSILTSVPMLALIAGQVGHDWGFYMMVTDLPKYMKQVLKFNVSQNGVWSSVPYVAMYISSMFCGWLSDLLIKKKVMNITFARKFFTSVASVGPSIFLLAASYSGCDRMLAVGMFTVAMGFMGAFYCGMKVNCLDLSPNYAATLMGIVNCLGAINGIITPYLAGALTTDHSLHSWRTVFWISFGVFSVTNIIYVCFASGELQPWNNVQSSKDMNEETDTISVDDKEKI